MIEKNAEYGETENVTIMEFGSRGDINMIDGVGDVYVCLLFKNKEKETPELNAIFRGDKWNPDVVMEFHSTDAIDLMIDTLIKLKDQFNSLRS